MSLVVLSCFAGRRDNLRILFRYVDKLVELGLVHEFHLWDYTRNIDDTIWLNAEYLKHSKYILKSVNNKTIWKEYYDHYTEELYPDHIIIKTDDDILYIDIQSFEKYINFRRADDETLLLFPSIVNNGVCAFVQQQSRLLNIPEEFPYDPAFGKLWESGQLCNILHNYFIDNLDSWLEKTSNIHFVSCLQGHRFSINFFAIKSKDLHYFKYIQLRDDEEDLTMHIPVKYNRNHGIYMPFTVAHLAFFKQRETGLNERDILEKYMKLSDKVLV